METLVLILGMLVDHLVWAFVCVWNEILKYCLVLCTSYVFIDASTEEYAEEEEAYAEEEEHFDNCTNQGKLILVQASKDTIASYLFREPFPFQVLFCKASLFSKSFYSSPLSEFILTTSHSRF